VISLPPTRYTLRSDAIAWSELGAEAVLVQLEADQIHVANSTAKILLEALRAGATLPELIEKITETFDVDEIQAKSDVEAFLAALKNAKIVSSE